MQTMAADKPLASPDSPDAVEQALARLQTALNAHDGPLTVALSGGIDSITLMTVAHRLAPQRTRAVHAVSPAVPARATRRCRQLALRLGWRLDVLDAGEFEDPRYRANPLDRCYYCKTNLFDSVLNRLPANGGRLATGTNADDLSDFRPGLRAAAEHQVWQPFAQAGIGKDLIRAIARLEGLGELSTLPAQPCLSSRVETAIPIDAADLQFVQHVERVLHRLCGPGDNRCRITAAGVIIQLPADHLLFGAAQAMARFEQQMARLCTRAQRPLAGIEPYRQGSAFVHDDADRAVITIRSVQRRQSPRTG